MAATTTTSYHSINPVSTGRVERVDTCLRYPASCAILWVTLCLGSLFAVTLLDDNPNAMLDYGAYIVAAVAGVVAVFCVSEVCMQRAPRDMKETMSIV